MALARDLQPVGLIELALVERIAIGLWRQRRLVTAETAYLEISCRPTVVAKAVSGMYDQTFGGNVKPEDLEPFDDEQAKWSEAVLVEIANIETFTVEAIARSAPLAFRQLSEDAEREEQSIKSACCDRGESLSSLRCSVWSH